MNGFWIEALDAIDSTSLPIEVHTDVRADDLLDGGAG